MEIGVKPASIWRPPPAAISWVRKSEKTRAPHSTRFCFSLFQTHEPGEAGRQIDAGSVPLHPSFTSFRPSC